MTTILRACVRCAESKPSSEFGKWAQGRDGLHSYCRACIQRANRARYLANPQRAKDDAARWAAANPERRKELDARKRKRAYAADPQEAYDTARRWAKANPVRVRGYDATKKAERRAAGGAVSWDVELDALALLEAADLCARRALATTTPWQIDHIVPLQCREASGLHNAFNLAVVPAAFNAAKKNRLLPHQRGFVLELRP